MSATNDMRHKRTPNLEIQAEADRKLADEEERIARLFGMCPWWNYDEFRGGLCAAVARAAARRILGSVICSAPRG